MSETYRPTMIKTLRPALTTRGNIKIGQKGKVRKSQSGKDWQPPEKLDHFQVTTLERAADGNYKRDEKFHEKHGDKPTEIAVKLLYDDPSLNFPTRLAAYKGTTLFCTGDGEIASRLNSATGEYEQIKCPCERQDPKYKGLDKCKMNGKLNVLLRGHGGVGGVWTFRTTSFHSITGILSSIMYIKTITGGQIAGIPLKLTVTPKGATDDNGKAITIYVVSLIYDGGDEEELERVGHEIALARASSRLKIEAIEEEARALLALPPPSSGVPLAGDVPEDIEEFYPIEEPVEQPKGAAAMLAALPDEEPLLIAGRTPQEFANNFISYLAGLQTQTQIIELMHAHDQPLERLKSAHPDQWEKVNTAVSKRQEFLSGSSKLDDLFKQGGSNE